MMKPRPQLIFFDLFNRLRKETDLSLSVEQYLLFLQAFRNRYGQQNLMVDRGKEQPRSWRGADLRFLCKTLWLTHKRYETQFDHIFNEYIKGLRTLDNDPSSSASKTTSSADKELDNFPDMEDVPEIAKPKDTQEEDQDSDGTIAPKEQTAVPEAPEKAPEIFVDISSEEDKSGITSFFQELIQDDDAITIDRHPFIFSDKYLPLNSRRLKHYWQHLRRFSANADSPEMDVKATIENLLTNGILTNIAKIPMKVYTTHFSIIVDNEGSMAVHSAWIELLVKSIRETVGFQHSSVHYFYNYPIRVLFQDAKHTQPIEIDRWLRKMADQNIFLFIISDGGATRWSAGNDRTLQWEAFFERIDSRIDHKIWLNPVPKSRWGGKSALYLSFMIDMVEATAEGLSRMPDIIKHL